MDKTIASDIMSTELITIHKGDTVEHALKILVNNRISGVPVVDSDRKMVGVLSEYDLICQIYKHPPPGEAAFRESIKFSEKMLSVSTQTKLEEILKHFIDSKFRRLPVVDKEGRLVGIISRPDLMKLFYYRAKLT